MKNISSLVIHTVKLKHSDNHSVVKGLVWQSNCVIQHFQIWTDLHSFFKREYYHEFKWMVVLFPFQQPLKTLAVPLLLIKLQMNCPSMVSQFPCITQKAGSIPLSLHKKKSFFFFFFFSSYISSFNFPLLQGLPICLAVSGPAI